MKFLYHTYFLSSQFANVNSSQAYLKYSKPGLFYFCTHWEASIKVKYLHICQRLPCTGARTAWNSSEKTSSWQERNCWSTGTEEHSSGLFSKTVVGRASHPSGPRRKELRVWLQHNLLFRLWTLLSPAGSWKKAAPVVANGDFCRDSKGARRYLLLLLLPRCPLQHSRSVPQHMSCSQHSSLKPGLFHPIFKLPSVKAVFFGGFSGSGIVQNWEDLKHSLSPNCSSKICAVAYRKMVQTCSSSALKKMEAQEGYKRNLCTAQHAKVNLKA